MSTDRLPLRDGPTVPAAVIRWLLDAADRGLVFTPTPAGRLRVSPHPTPGSPDDQFCRAHRDALLMLVEYVESVTSWPLDCIGTPWPVPSAASVPVSPAPTPAREPIEVPLWP